MLGLVMMARSGRAAFDRSKCRACGFEGALKEGRRKDMIMTHNPSDVRCCHAGLLLGALLCAGAPASEMIIVNILGWWHYDRPDLLGVPHWACELSRSHRQMPDHKVMFSP